MTAYNTLDWHTRDGEALLRALKSSTERGLSSAQASTLLERYGENTFSPPKYFTVLLGVRKQLISPLSIVLMFGFGVTLFLHEYSNAVVILIALCINMVIGVLQEGKAAQIFERLVSAVQTQATVLRDGTKTVIPSNLLVPGDIVFLEGGRKVPADIRLLDVTDLRINESVLTGEWVSVSKSSAMLEGDDIPLHAQKNMAFMGSVVAEGIGMGVVVATGAETQFGHIAGHTGTEDDEHTPLQVSIQRLAYTIVGVIGLIIAGIFAIGIAQGESVAEMLLIAVAVAVAAMPEGLPAAVTVTLAVAMEHILKKGGLVKHLLAAETLGSTTVILTDKTGTLTEGVMEVNNLYTKSQVATIQNAAGDTLTTLKIAVLASDAFIESEDAEGVHIHGRPIEKAIIEAGLHAGLRQTDLCTHGEERQAFVQFEASRRYAISLNKHINGQYALYVTGSPEHILAHCSHYLEDGASVALTSAIREQFKSIQDTLSAQGMRFTAVAYRMSREGVIPHDVQNPQDGENLGFTFAGLLSFGDAIRQDAQASIAEAESAGIRVLMVTGDHKETAGYVARMVGLQSTRMVLGDDFARMSDDALLFAAHEGAIFARMLPEQKLRLAHVLRASGEVVAMTGDGVNDAPALIAANIGLAVNDGTDIAKEAADMILMKSNFSVIIDAIREGRRALSNLRKIIAYLLSISAGEIILIGGAVAIGSPLPLIPAQILWVNIIVEGFMSFPFAFEPADMNIMRQKPHRLIHGRESILQGGFGKMVLASGMSTGAVLFGAYLLLLSLGVTASELQTAMFVAVSVGCVSLALSFKDLHRSIWDLKLFSNIYLLAGIGISMLLLLLPLVWHPLASLLSLSTVGLLGAVILIGAVVVNIVFIETAKRFLLPRY